jgi:acetyltransferase-like isoleucine patch superfamily enzyme
MIPIVPPTTTALYKSHGTGEVRLQDFGAIGEHCVLEAQVLVFHAENIFLGANVYVGHQTILKAYYKNEMRIGDRTWVGQQCFFHSAGGLTIEHEVGIAPGVRILTSVHDEAPQSIAVLKAPLRFAPVHIETGADIGVGAVVLPGVRIGRGAIIGAGSVINRDVPPYAVVAGVPGKVLRYRATEPATGMSP